MDSALNMLRILRFALLGAIVLYAALCFHAQVSAIPQPMVFRVISLVGVTEVVIIFFFRRKFVLQTEPLLRSEPFDPAVLARWRAGYIITWALSTSIALYGVVLRYIGFAFNQVCLFLIAGFVLILFFSPRRPN